MAKGGRPGTIVAMGRRISTAAAIAALAAQPSQSADSGFVARYCLACHGESTATAGVSLEGLRADAPGQRPEIWERVLRKVASGEMPPPEMPSPELAERSLFTARLERALDAAAAAEPNVGRTPPHRLNRAEYANSVRDLLDLDVDIRHLLPGDDSGYGFDNIAEVLSLTPALMERYLIAARWASRLAVGRPGLQPQRDVFVRNRETGFALAGHAPAKPGDLPPRAVRGAAIRYYFPLDGEYVIAANLDRGESLIDYERRSGRVRVTAGIHAVSVSFPGGSPRSETTKPDGEAARELPHPPLDVRIDGRRVTLAELEDTTTPYRLRNISIEGPFNGSGPGLTPSRRKIFSCLPDTAADLRPCARAILSRLARQAYRRPVNESDTSALMAIFETGLSQGGFEAGIERAIRAILVSPNFLFRVEPDPPGATAREPYRLGDYALASRLSYFLWSSLPDDVLLASAESGKLSDPAELERQARRMLADPKSRALVDNFAGQWLELRKVASIKPDNRIFPGFNADLRLAIRRETELFVSDALRRNASILELLDSNHTFLNERLAEHYGIERVRGTQFRRVALEDPRRGGLLGQGSILAVTSYPNRTSVVIRGKWVLENLFGMPPPPPPPDIPELEEAAPPGQELTVRELLTLHSQSPSCSGCHVRMDPIGFALENFDAIGRWRDSENGEPIDASGELPGGVRFNGPAELRQALTTTLRDNFVRTVAGKLLTYALGRGLEYYDRPAVRSIARATEELGYGFADMVVAVVQSMPFQMRMGPE